MADAGSNAVHTGFWIDRDREGPIRAATLTLTNQKAAALLAFLAIVVTFTANRSFKICRFWLHYSIRPSDAGTDSVTRRAKSSQQVILRNSETAGSALVSLLEIISERSGPSVSGRAMLTSVLLKLGITAHWLVFITLGILTSQIAMGRTVVSRRTSTCGKWGIKESAPPSESVDATDEWYKGANELMYNGTLDAENYVHNCYGEQSARGFFDCSKFVSRSLPFSEEHNAACPFERGICLQGDNSAFAMDSGNISFSALGINRKHSKDLSVRRRSTCAVVDSKPFYIGPLKSEDPTIPLGENRTGFLYSFGKDESGGNQTLFYRSQRSGQTYELVEYYWVGNSTSKALLPNSDTNDVSIMLLRGQGVEYFDIQDDPWFAAHTEVEYYNFTGIETSGPKRYQLDHFLNVLVCDERLQYCNHITGHCTQWHGLLNGVDDIASLLGDPLLKGIDGHIDMTRSTQIVMESTMNSYIALSIQGRGYAALQASKFFNNGYQFRLDPEQWKIEVRYWFKMALARIQLEIFNTVERPVNVDPKQSKNGWEEGLQLVLCGNIKFRSANHTSLSVAGIAAILLCTIVLTTISFFDLLLASRFLRGRFQNFISPWEETENLALLKKTMNVVSLDPHYSRSMPSEKNRNCSFH